LVEVGGRVVETVTIGVVSVGGSEGSAVVVVVAGVVVVVGT
jgi:hypothetical protein